MIVKSQVKYIQSLGHKKHRDQDDAFIAEGPKLIHELLHAQNVQPVELFAVKDWIALNQSSLKKLTGLQLIEINEQELSRISFLTTPNQVLGIFKKPVFTEIKPEGRVTLLLDNIQDPGNAGTILRIADWFAVKQIICSEESADIFNPKVVQATMGSISRVQVVYTNLLSFIETHRDIPVYATLLDADSIRNYKPIKQGMIIIGNESKGISKDLLKIIDHKITIPKTGEAESLNAAVATGIILSHLLA